VRLVRPENTVGGLPERGKRPGAGPATRRSAAVKKYAAVKRAGKTVKTAVKSRRAVAVKTGVKTGVKTPAVKTVVGSMETAVKAAVNRRVVSHHYYSVAGTLRRSRLPRPRHPPHH